MLEFVKQKEVSGKKGKEMATGQLKFKGKSYAAVSGGHGKGYLPNGDYSVKTRNAVDKDLDAAFRIGNTQFFIPIVPNFDTARSGLGIHPDGGVYEGTEGCIGLVGNDASKFWQHWMSYPVKDRPQTLRVR